MAVTINGTSGINTPGVVNTAAETIATTLAVTGATTLGSTVAVTGAATMGSTLAVTGAITGSGLSTTLYPLVSGTPVATTSGTSVDFTGIPSWVKRITVMYKGVSTTSTSNWLIQIGAGSVTTTGYVSMSAFSSSRASSTIGFVLNSGPTAGNAYSGNIQICSFGSNIWTQSGNISGDATNEGVYTSGGYVTLGGTLDRIRITTTNGTDTFDAGSVNILYE